MNYLQYKLYYLQYYVYYLKYNKCNLQYTMHDEYFTLSYAAAALCSFGHDLHWANILTQNILMTQTPLPRTLASSCDPATWGHP